MSQRDIKTMACGTWAVSVPSKLNLFLHVTGRRPDGYHLLESVFLPINWCDELQARLRHDGKIVRLGDMDWPETTDLVLKAAHLLRDYAVQHQQMSLPMGCDLSLSKSIPHGAGLGGGSADAAYTLRLLNALWALKLPDAVLSQLGLTLGADVPFFLQDGAALVRGIGEEITPVEVRAPWFVVAVPPVSVSTAVIFKDTMLRRDHGPVSPDDLAHALDSPVWVFGENDLEPVATREFPAVARLLETMKQAAHAAGLPRQACKMSGSGGAIFCSCHSVEEAQAIASHVQSSYSLGSGIKIQACHQHF